MGQPQADQSMDEILASIRRIISEDEPTTPAPEAEAAPAERLDTLDLRHSVADEEPEEVLSTVEPESAQEEVATGGVDAFFEGQSALETPEPAVVESQVFEAAPEPEVHEEVVVAEAVEESPIEVAPILEQASPVAAAPEPESIIENREPEEESMLTKTTAAAATSAFDALAENIRIADGEGRTLESLIERMIEPMLKDWMDANLARIVEEKVEDEVRRIARRR